MLLPHAQLRRQFPNGRVHLRGASRDVGQGKRQDEPLLLLLPGPHPPDRQGGIRNDGDGPLGQRFQVGAAPGVADGKIVGAIHGQSREFREPVGKRRRDARGVPCGGDVQLGGKKCGPHPEPGKAAIRHLLALQPLGGPPFAGLDDVSAPDENPVPIGPAHGLVKTDDGRGVEPIHGCVGQCDVRDRKIRQHMLDDLREEQIAVAVVVEGSKVRKFLHGVVRLG